MAAIAAPLMVGGPLFSALRRPPVRPESGAGHELRFPDCQARGRRGLRCRHGRGSAGEPQVDVAPGERGRQRRRERRESRLVDGGLEGRRHREVGHLQREEEREANARVWDLCIAARDPDIPVLDRYLVGRERIAEMVDNGRINLCSVAWLLNAASRDAAVACFHRRLGRQAERILERQGVV